MIQAILFDFGNTLVSTELDWEVIIDQSIECLVTYLNSTGIKVDKDSFGQAFLTIRNQNFKKAELEQREYTAEESLIQMLDTLGIKNIPQNILETAVDVFFSPEIGLYPVVPQVPEILTELKTRGYKLAIVSNATSGRLIRKAATMRDLTKYFETIIVSADVGYRKPHPQIFQLALDTLKVKPEQTVMIGDLLNYDIIGANNLGMKSILAKYVLPKEDYNNRHPDIIPDAVATSFPEILTIIDKL